MTEVTMQTSTSRATLDDEPDLVVIQVYITSAKRAYEIADHYRRRGSVRRAWRLARHVAARRSRAARRHIFLGPGEDTWPQFLHDYRRGRPRARYRSTNGR